MIKLSKSDYEKILHHAESELPNEACGLIGGVKEGSDKIIKKVYLLTNIDHSNEHFSLDPKEQLAAIKDNLFFSCGKNPPDILLFDLLIHHLQR